MGRTLRSSIFCCEYGVAATPAGPAGVIGSGGGGPATGVAAGLSTRPSARATAAATAPGRGDAGGASRASTGGGSGTRASSSSLPSSSCCSSGRLGVSPVCSLNTGDVPSDSSTMSWSAGDDHVGEAGAPPPPPPRLLEGEADEEGDAGAGCPRAPAPPPDALAAAAARASARVRSCGTRERRETKGQRPAMLSFPFLSSVHREPEGKMPQARVAPHPGSEPSPARTRSGVPSSEACSPSRPNPFPPLYPFRALGLADPDCCRAAPPLAEALPPAEEPLAPGAAAAGGSGLRRQKRK